EAHLDVRLVELLLGLEHLQRRRGVGGERLLAEDRQPRLERWQQHRQVELAGHGDERGVDRTGREGVLDLREHLCAGGVLGRRGRAARVGLDDGRHDGTRYAGLDALDVVGAHCAGPDDSDAEVCGHVLLPQNWRARCVQPWMWSRVRRAIGNGVSTSQPYMSCSTIAKMSGEMAAAASMMGPSSGTPCGGSIMIPPAT